MHGQNTYAYGMLPVVAFDGDTPAADDLTPMDSFRQALGYLAFALILVPVPHSLYSTFGIHCPCV
jgi:hypothetical protein